MRSCVEALASESSICFFAQEKKEDLCAALHLVLALDDSQTADMSGGTRNERPQCISCARVKKFHEAMLA